MSEAQTVIVNLKNYKESTGKNIEKFLNSLNKVTTHSEVRVIIAIAPIDIAIAQKYSKFEVFSQAVDPVTKGSFTGKIPIESLLEIGVRGSLMNHSENRIDPVKIEAIIQLSRNYGFENVLCVESLEEAGRYAALKPGFIAYEPPNLIGGDISVTTAEPSIISDVVNVCRKQGVSVLVGAGVKTGRDAQKSIELGAEGVLIASGIVKSNDPAKALEMIINGIIGKA